MTSHHFSLYSNPKHLKIMIKIFTLLIVAVASYSCDSIVNQNDDKVCSSLNGGYGLFLQCKMSKVYRFHILYCPLETPDLAVVTYDDNGQSVDIQKNTASLDEDVYCTQVCENLMIKRSDGYNIQLSLIAPEEKSSSKTDTEEWRIATMVLSIFGIFLTVTFFYINRRRQRNNVVYQPILNEDELSDENNNL